MKKRVRKQIDASQKAKQRALKKQRRDEIKAREREKSEWKRNEKRWMQSNLLILKDRIKELEDLTDEDALIELFNMRKLFYRILRNENLLIAKQDIADLHFVKNSFDNKEKKLQKSLDAEAIFEYYGYIHYERCSPLVKGLSNIQINLIKTLNKEYAFPQPPKEPDYEKIIQSANNNIPQKKHTVFWTISAVAFGLMLFGGPAILVPWGIYATIYSFKHSKNNKETKIIKIIEQAKSSHQKKLKEYQQQKESYKEIFKETTKRNNKRVIFFNKIKNYIINDHEEQINSLPDNIKNLMRKIEINNIHMESKQQKSNFLFDVLMHIPKDLKDDLYPVSTEQMLENPFSPTKSAKNYDDIFGVDNMDIKKIEKDLIKAMKEDRDLISEEV